MVSIRYFCSLALFSSVKSTPALCATFWKLNLGTSFARNRHSAQSGRNTTSSYNGCARFAFMRCASLLLLPLLLLAQADRLAEQSQQAKQAMAVGRFEEAAVIYRELITNLPDNPGLGLNLGLALHSSGDFAGAIRSLENAVKLDPRLAPAWLF